MSVERCVQGREFHALKQTTGLFEIKAQILFKQNIFGNVNDPFQLRY